MRTPKFINYDMNKADVYNWFDNGVFQGSANVTSKNMHRVTRVSSLGDRVLPNPYSWYKVESVAMPWYQRFTNEDDWHTAGHALEVIGNPGCIKWDLWRVPTQAEYGECYNAALEDLGEQVRGGTDISIDLFQWKQTKALGSDVKKVLTSLLKVRNPKSLLKVGGSAWLGWVYGVKPTLQSIYDIATDFERRYSDQGIPFTGKAKYTCHEKFGVGWSDGWPSEHYECLVEREYKLRYKIGVTLKIPETTPTRLARISSLNPVSVAWELVPFSFVADWFLNVGGFIRETETALLYNSYFKHGYRTKTFVTTIDRWSVVKPSDQRYFQGKTAYHSCVKDFDRIVLTQYPYPAFPSINAKLGSGRLLNAAALLSNFLKK